MKRYITIILAFLTFISSINALQVPDLIGRINDNAGILSSNQEKSLEAQLKSYEDSTSTQIAVLIIDSLEGDSLESFSISVVDKWGLGTKDNDNGVLLLVSVKDRKIRLEVGYGLEGTLTDAKSDYIIRNVISPFFKKGQYFEGIQNGVAAINGLISGEYQISTKNIQESAQSSRSTGRSPVSIIFILLFIVFSTLGKRGLRGGRRGSGIGTFLILNSLLGGSSRSSGGFGGSGGGFGGGGFSGGGGGFGGGGSSGGW